jgi:hypothetical protein
MASTKQTSKNKTQNSKIDSIKSFIEDVTENVIEGATVVTETIKDTSTKAFVASSEFVEEASQRINNYTDKVSLHKEEKSILDRQNEIIHSFGEKTLNHYLKNDSVHKNFLTTKNVTELVNEYKGNLKNLTSIEKKLKKLNS